MTENIKIKKNELYFDKRFNILNSKKNIKKKL